MPPQGYGASQGSDGDYQWTTYEQYGSGGADLRPPFHQFTPMAAPEVTAWGLQQQQQPQWYDPYGSCGWYTPAGFNEDPYSPPSPATAFAQVLGEDGCLLPLLQQAAGVHRDVFNGG